MSPPPDEWVASFFGELPRLDALVRELTRDLRLTAGITLADTGETLVVDLASQPLRVLREGDPGACTIRLKGTAAHLHRVLLGEEPLGLALTRKHVLVRGSTAKLTQFYPLLRHCPVLYEDHGRMLRRVERARGRLRRGAARLGRRALDRGGWAAGYALGKLKQRALPDLRLADLLASLSDGLEASRRGRKR